MESGHPEDVGLRKLRCPCGSSFQKLSSAPINTKIQITSISATTKLKSSTKAFTRKGPLIRMTIAVFAWLITGSSTKKSTDNSAKAIMNRAQSVYIL